MLLFNQFCKDFFHLIFPDLCNACGTTLFEGEKQICIRCRHDLPYTDFHLHPNNTVARLFWGRMPCHAAMALLYFRKGSKVQNLIHSLKYKDQTELGFVLGDLMGEKLKQSSLYAGADLIIPVPLHPKKERSRGYNQAKYIADGIGAVLQLPVDTISLIKSTATGTQTKKNRYHRFENMQSIFKVSDRACLAGKHIILVDDVITTGATLESCGQVLLANGAGKISIVAAAFAE